MTDNPSLKMALGAVRQQERERVLSEVIAALRDEAAKPLDGIAAYDHGSRIERVTMIAERKSGFYRAADELERMAKEGRFDG